MDFLTVYIVAVIAAAVVLALVGWQDHNNGGDIKLGEILTAIFVALFPVINVFVTILLVAYLINKFSDRVVIKGKV